MRQPCGGELLAVAAALDKTALQGAYLLVQQVVCLVNQADQRIGDDGRIRMGKPGGVGPRLTGLIRPITLPLRERPQCPHGAGLGLVLCPLAELALAEEVLVIQEQFIQAGTGDVHQTQFGLAGSRGSPAAFGDVLAAAAGRLHHLVHGA